MLDQRLVRAINRGRCFALVGSGPSCEIGYLSWQRLAEETYRELSKNGLAADAASYEAYIREKKYPELFRQAEVDIGGRHKLVDFLKRLLPPAVRNRGGLYETLRKWPFACYLTTNYDDELAQHLRGIGEHFTVIRNRIQDFYAMRDSASHLIQKLHSDLDHPDEAVITSADYRRLYIDPEGEYFRVKLRQVLEMFDVFIIGHSLSDPDIDQILQLARNTASPSHPIYMIASGFSKADEREYLEKYNIVLVQYSNDDGTHSQLRRLLAAADRFIVPRRRRRESTESLARPRVEVEAAAALFLYRRLQGVDATENMAPLILAGIASVGEGGITADDLMALPALKVFSHISAVFSEVVSETLHNLVGQQLVIEASGVYSIITRGLAQVEEIQTARDTEKDQAYGQFCLDLKHGYEDATEEEVRLCQELAEKAIVASFASRGLTIANQVFAGQTASPEELSDIFGYVSDVAAEIQSNRMDLRAAFVEAMHQFLVEPSSPQKKYLASVSQGYFLFHLLGLDPKCSRLRGEIFKRTLWFCDSSVLLPLVAVGCHNHDYAVELFQSLRAAQAVLYTTPKLLQEAWEHFLWAVRFLEKTGVGSPEFLCAALVKGSYKQNLFLDGYIRLSADGQVGSFRDYRELFLPHKIDRSSFEALFNKVGVGVKSASDMNGFAQEDWVEIEEAKRKIREKRESSGTYRSNLQVESEADVWVVVNNLRTGRYSIADVDNVERIYFVSQSRVIDQVFQPQAVVTWTPEALYRYMSALPGRQTNPDLLQQCMLHEYYYAGISFIDRERYVRFFGPSIDSAKASYEQEKSRYIAEVEDAYVGKLDEAFEKTAGLEKPFFVAQMGWRVAEASRQREEQARQRALEAEAKVKELQSEKDRAWKSREKKRQVQEAAILRNLQDPKHMRKRLKQAKKRRKKKKR